MVNLAKPTADGVYLNNDLKNKKEVQFTKEAPAWRIVNEGLNVEAICQNNGCQAQGKYVWTHLKNTDETGFGDINFIQRINRVVCPMCKTPTPEDTVYGIGFYNCVYSYDGQSHNGKRFEDRVFKEKVQVQNGFVKYEGSEIKTFWKFLQIKVTTLPK